MQLKTRLTKWNTKAKSPTFSTTPDDAINRVTRNINVSPGISQGTFGEIYRELDLGAIFSDWDITPPTDFENTLDPNPAIDIRVRGARGYMFLGPGNMRASELLTAINTGNYEALEDLIKEMPCDAGTVTAECIHPDWEANLSEGGMNPDHYFKYPCPEVREEVEKINSLFAVTFHMKDLKNYHLGSDEKYYSHYVPEIFHGKDHDIAVCQRHKLGVVKGEFFPYHTAVAVSDFVSTSDFPCVDVPEITTSVDCSPGRIIEATKTLDPMDGNDDYFYLHPVNHPSLGHAYLLYERLDMGNAYRSIAWVQASTGHIFSINYIYHDQIDSRYWFVGFNLNLQYDPPTISHPTFSKPDESRFEINAFFNEYVWDFETPFNED